MLSMRRSARATGRAGRGRLALAIGLGLVIAATAAIPAASHLVTRKPGHRPADVNPKDLPVLGGKPRPERLAYKAAEGCSGGPQKGTVKLRRFIDHWFIGHSLGIYNCRSIRGGSGWSVHAEGRALDWALDARRPKQARAARRIRRFFLSTATLGGRRSMARRFGLQQIIWNNHHWNAAQDKAGGSHAGWHYCDCNHVGHMHIEQRWAGALMRTSAYTGYRTTHQGPHPE